MSRYAIVDVETTGLSPAHHHRIVELALVLVDDQGQVVYEWDTLVNPERDVAATEIHGLTAADVYDAPTFREIAGELARLLNGRVPVAHNLAFDAPFLAAEYERLGVVAPLSSSNGLCTMRLASRYLPSSRRTLEACCRCIGSALESAHAALHDAHATATLLAHYMREDHDFITSWSEVIAAAQTQPWPSLPVYDTRRVPRQQATSTAQDHFLGRLASRTPRSELPFDADSYLELLDRILLDRQLSRHEQDELVAAAGMMGIGREEAMRLHRAYLHALGRVALEDGVVTPEERSDLCGVAELLGLNDTEVDAALEPGERHDFEVTPDAGRFALREGDAVVFTGEAPGHDRSALIRQARDLGLRVTSAVSGRTRLLVAADPDSISSKARKARELGVPIVDYESYLKMLHEPE